MTTTRGASLRELVELVLRTGSLYGARPSTATRSLTVAGRRRVRIRLQADICAALYDPQGLAISRNYPDIADELAELVDELKPAGRATRETTL